MNKKVILILTFLFAITSSFAKEFNCKERLPANINSYSPVIVPVISIDSKYLYFDRKEHPLNTGGYKDVDDIWFSEKNSNGIWSNPVKLGEPINSKTPNVLFSISPDGKKALLYTDYYIKSHRLSGFVIADRINNKFLNPKSMKIKHFYNGSKNFYGFLSANNNILILSIKSKHCLGQEDLYVSFIDESTGIWSEPMNLGKTINSESDEIAPFLAYDGKTLYFSSNRQKGYGNYDLYMSRRLDNTWKHWSTPTNLGKPINTQFKENGIYLTALSDSAYIISSEIKVVQSGNINKSFDTIALRSGIYKVCIPKSLQPEPYLILKGSFKNNKENLIKQKIDFSIKSDKDSSQYTTYDGKFLFVLNSGKKYKIKINADGFEDSEFQINTKNMSKPRFVTKNIILKPKSIEDISFPAIFFEYNKTELTKSIKRKLLEITNGIKDKNIKLKILAYADTSGTELYNYNLSKKRGENTKRYLINLGLNPANIIVEGKGETLRFGNSDDKNRRVEIIISH